MTPGPGWYPDPSSTGTLRWFDGTAWTEHQRPVPAAVPAPSATTPARVSAPATLVPDAAPAVQAAPSWAPSQPWSPTVPQSQAGPQPSVPQRSGPQPTVPQPTSRASARRRRASGTRRALVVAAVVVAALLLLVVVAAVALPLIVQQRDRAALAAIDCVDIARDAVALSREESGTELIPLAAIEDVTVTRDERPDVPTPAKGAEAFVLTCAGTGTWDDGVVTPVTVDVYITAEREPVIAIDWQE